MLPTEVTLKDSKEDIYRAYLDTKQKLYQCPLTSLGVQPVPVYRLHHEDRGYIFTTSEQEKSSLETMAFFALVKENYQFRLWQKPDEDKDKIAICRKLKEDESSSEEGCAEKDCPHNKKFIQKISRNRTKLTKRSHCNCECSFRKR